MRACASLPSPPLIRPPLLAAVAALPGERSDAWRHVERRTERFVLSPVPEGARLVRVELDADQLDVRIHFRP